jgi:serine/threonine-protein kinase
LTLGSVTEQFSESVDKGKVIDQNPDANTRVEPSSRVNLVISKGKETAIVPSVIGQTESDARLNIQTRGFNVKVVDEESGATCQETPGRVCKQNPPGGTELPKGDTVTITVAREPGTPTESPSGSPSASPSAFPLMPLAIPFRKRRR